MGTGYLIDTNVLIDAQIGRLTPIGKHYLSKIIDTDFTVSFITYIEFLGYKDISKSSEDFIALAKVIEIDSSIINACITLRREKSIKLPDAIIAATALAKDLVLVTRNVGDFKNILDLNIINPFEL